MPWRAAVSGCPATISTGTPPNTANGSRRSPRRCSPGARSRGRTPMTVIGSPAVVTRSSSSRAAQVFPTTRMCTVCAMATKASPSRPSSKWRISGAACWRWTIPNTGYYRNALNPYLSPAAVARWEPFIDEVVRACLDEKIEVGPDRLRRRPRQHRPGRAHAGDAGHPAGEVDHLQRTGARLRVHAAELARRRARRELSHGDGRSTCSPISSRCVSIRGRASSTRSTGSHRR